MAMKGYLTCPNCGMTGPDVVSKLKYIGGQGMMSVIQCEDETACWARWDEQHSMTGFHLETRLEREKKQPVSV